MAVYDVNGKQISSNGGQGYDPIDDDIPMVFIEGTLPASKDDGDLGVTINYSSKTRSFSSYATLKVQGSSSQFYPKKNFTVKLFNDSNKSGKNKISFRNWEKSNKFVLKANWIDHSHARNVVNARLWSQIVKSRDDFFSLPKELRDGNLAVDGFPVRVYNNGVYYGIYTWNLPKDAMYGVSDKINENCILNSEMNNDQSCAFNGTSLSNWSDELHDAMTPAVNSGWSDALTFVKSSTDAAFITGLNDHIDVLSVIDYDIIARLACIVDNLCKNQIFFTYNSIKWYEGAYDLDGTWGLPPVSGKQWYAYDTAFQTGYVAYTDYGITNNLYNRVEALFKTMFKERYSKLRSGVLSEDNIIYQFESFTSPISPELYALDYADTTANGAFTGIPYKNANNIDQIKTFVPQRLAYMDGIITNM